jgi:VCBS repeat-containing protein
VFTDEDTLANGMLSASDADGDPLTYNIATNGSIGTAIITNPTTGAFTYTPDPGENGTDKFTFKASDGNASSNIATVTVTINPINDAPAASPGAVITDEDTFANGMLNASDADGDPLTYSIATNGSTGTANITNPTTGAFTYTPDPGENGTDSFTFKASDGNAESNIATVTVTINAVNDPPVASGSCGTTFQDPILPQPYESTLSATDPDSPMLTYALLDPTDGSFRGDGPIITAKGGSVTISNRNTGAFTYQPDTTAGDKRGKDFFEYQVTDTDGLADIATEVVIVNQTIMPLGDSITAGRIDDTGPPVELRGGYRKPLYDALTTAEFNVDFVGSVIHGQDLPDFDFNHEGHGGWTASEIAWGRAGGYPTDGVRAWLDDNPADVVLLHAGTNALDRNNDIDIEVILDEIDQWEASAQGNPVSVILALIVDRDPIDPEVAAFNSNVLILANDRIANGDDIIIANHHDALTYPDDMGDQLHLKESGYIKMATLWFDILTDNNLIDKCP